MRRLVWFALGFGGACGLGSYLAPGAAAAAHGCWSRASMGSSAVPGEEEAGYGGRRPGLFGLGAGICVVYLYDGVYLQPARQADGQTVKLTLQVAGYPCRRMMAAGWMEPSFWKGGLMGPGCTCSRRKLWSRRPGDCPAQLRLTAPGGSRETTITGPVGFFLLAYTREAGTVTRGGGPGCSGAAAPGVGRQIEGLFRRIPAVRPGAAAGEKAGLSYSQRNELSLAGMSHIVAVSGMHLSILFLLWCMH